MTSDILNDSSRKGFKLFLHIEYLLTFGFRFPGNGLAPTSIVTLMQLLHVVLWTKNVQCRTLEIHN